LVTVAGKMGELPDKTRRESVPGGSVAASLLLTVLSGSSPLLPATFMTCTNWNIFY